MFHALSPLPLFRHLVVARPMRRICPFSSRRRFIYLAVSCRRYFCVGKREEYVANEVNLVSFNRDNAAMLDEAAAAAIQYALFVDELPL